MIIILGMGQNASERGTRNAVHGAREGRRVPAERHRPQSLNGKALRYGPYGAVA